MLIESCAGPFGQYTQESGPWKSNGVGWYIDSYPVFNTSVCPPYVPIPSDCVSSSAG